MGTSPASHPVSSTETREFEEATIDWQVMQRGFEVLASWSSVDRLAGLAAPTLVVGGREDPVTSWPQQVRIAKRVPAAELLLLDGASRFVWVDRPAEFWAAVGAFLVRAGVLVEPRDGAGEVT